MSQTLPALGGARPKSTYKLELALRATLSVLVRPTNPLPELIELIGYEEMLKFLLVFGGRVLYVPKVSELSATLNVASAAIAVQEGRLTNSKAVKDYGITHQQLKTALAVLHQEEAMRQKLSRREKELLAKTGLLDL